MERQNITSNKSSGFTSDSADDTGAESLSDTLGHAVSGAGRSLQELNDKLRLNERMEEHPFAMIGAAVGVGFVLGGGLFTPLTGRIVGWGVRMGLRLAVLPLLREQLGRAFEGFDTLSDETSVSDAPIT